MAGIIDAMLYTSMNILKKVRPFRLIGTVALSALVGAVASSVLVGDVALLVELWNMLGAVPICHWAKCVPQP